MSAYIRRMRWPIALVTVLSLSSGACARRPEPENRQISDAGAFQEPTADFSGSYSSNWGPVECTQNESDVRCVYQNLPAKMECEASGRRLRCKWNERKARGRAKFIRHPNGDLVGTWGHRQSDDNKGGWMLTKK